MAGVNKVILVGNLGKDPEVRHLENGAVLARFPIATSESYKDREGNRVDQTEWHNVVVWRKLAEIAESYLKKGSQVYLEGKLRTRSWDDDQGVKKYATEVVADTFTMLGKREDNGGAPMGGSNANLASSNNSGGGNNYQASAASSAPNVQEDEADDLPF